MFQYFHYCPNIVVFSQLFQVSFGSKISKFFFKHLLNDYLDLISLL